MVLKREKRFISPGPWGKPCHSLNHAAVRHDLPKISIETYFWYCFSGQPIACFNANPRGVGRRRHDKCCRRSSGHRSLVNRSYTLRYGLSCFPARGRRARGGAARGCILGIPCWRYLARFGGVVIGLGVKRSGLDTRLVNRFLARIPATYLGVVYSIFFAAFMLAWIVPSASARVALLVPIMIALSEGLGFKKGSKGQTGLVLASAMGTMTPAFGILPANVPNMALFGAIESIHGIRLTYGEYLLLNFPVLGIGALVLYPLVIGVLFKDQAEAAAPQEVPRKWSISGAPGYPCSGSGALDNGHLARCFTRLGGARRGSFVSLPKNWFAAAQDTGC